MKQVMKQTSMKTKREALDPGLKTQLRLKRQENIRKYRGKLDWTGDLDDMRTDKIELVPLQPMKRLKRFLKGIDTVVKRDKDRI